MFEVGLVAFLIFGNAGLWLFGRFLGRLKTEFPDAWEKAGKPGMITLLLPVSSAEFMNWQRVVREDSLPAEMLRLLRRGRLFSLLALAAWFVCVAALLSSQSGA